MLLPGFCGAQTTPQVTLDTNPSLFTVLAALNTCGYNQELNISDPLRMQIRDEIAKAAQASDEAKEATKDICAFYDAHQKPDVSRNLSQYISLALFLNPPPDLGPKVKEGDVAPDANALLTIVPLLQRFYKDVGLGAIWQRHELAYSALTERYHEPLAKMLFDTEIYLKLPSSGYLGRHFYVYIDALGGPGQTNARQYGSDYYVVVSPGNGSFLKLDQIRHTYLHYLLDPLTLKYPEYVKRLEPLLDEVKTAPMDESFKTDSGLLVNECLIRAIEARLMGDKVTEEQRQKVVDQAVSQGFILTPYFYDTLVKFEKEPTGFRNAFGDMLANIDLRREEKFASQVQFANNADPELLHLARPMEGKLLNTAEQRLAVGDFEAAEKLAQEALDEKSEDQGHALFILARVATRQGDMQNARSYFQRTLEAGGEPKVVAWSHIYLGRIFDLQENREAALEQYRAALNGAATMPEVKAAAERGLQQAYEPPSHPQEN
jgi:tetratricopeptide (TPR) repeat protein